MAPFVIGADLAIEESQGVNSLPTVTGIKTSLMGPLAGIGDTLLLSTPGAILVASRLPWLLKEIQLGLFFGWLLWLQSSAWLSRCIRWDIIRALNLSRHCVRRVNFNH